MSSSSEWVAFRPSSDTMVFAEKEENRIILVEKSLGKDELVTRRYHLAQPPDDDFLDGGAQFNVHGNRLAVLSHGRLFIVTLLNQFQAWEREEVENGTVKYRSKDGQISLQGRFNGNQLSGEFIQPAGLKFEATKQGDDIGCFIISNADDTAKTWNIGMSVEVDVKHLSGQQSAIARDVLWHPASPNTLCILDGEGHLLAHDFETNNTLRVDLHANRGEVVCDYERLAMLSAEKDDTCDVWQRLACYILGSDGSVVLVCPIGFPGLLDLPESALEAATAHERAIIEERKSSKEPFHQHEQSLAYLLSCYPRERGGNTATTWSCPAVQVLCEAPGCPDVRYQSSPVTLSNAFDFCVSKLLSHTVIHRTWTCGRVDVVLWPDGQARPWWASRVPHLDRNNLMHNDDAKSSPRKGARLGTLLRGYEKSRADLLGQNRRIVKCAEVWNLPNAEAFVYHSSSYPSVFILVERNSGEAVMLKALWAEDEQSLADVETSIAMIDVVKRFENKRAITFFQTSSAGLGMLQRVSNDAACKIDLLKFLRAWASNDLVSHQSSFSGDDDEREILRNSANSMWEDSQKQYAALQNLRKNVWLFFSSIPPEIRGIVVDKQPDDRTTTAVMSWLGDYYHQLGEDPNSLFNQLYNEERAVFEAHQKQCEEINRQMKSLKDNMQFLETLGGLIGSLDASAKITDQMANLLQVNAANLRDRIDRLPAQLVGTGLRPHFRRLCAKVESLHDQVRALGNLLNENEDLEAEIGTAEPNADRESNETDSRPLSIEEEQLLENLNQLDNKIHTLLGTFKQAAAGVSAERKVFFIARNSNEIIESIAQLESAWRNLTMNNEQCEFFIDPRILEFIYQKNQRRDLGEELGTSWNQLSSLVPYEVSLGHQGSANVIILSRHVIVKSIGRGRFVFIDEAFGGRESKQDMVKIVPLNLDGEGASKAELSLKKGLLAHIVGDPEGLDDAENLDAFVAQVTRPFESASVYSIAELSQTETVSQMHGRVLEYDT